MGLGSFQGEFLLGAGKSRNRAPSPERETRLTTAIHMAWLATGSFCHTEGAAVSAGGGASGKVNQKVDPFPGALSTPTCPSWRSIIVWQMCSPSPSPTP